MKSFIFVIIICVRLIANGQDINIIPTTFDYSKADSIALNFPKKKYKNYTELSGPLTQDLKTDHEKLRVLFRWITDNIKYSYGNNTDDADKVVSSKKAVCIGYSTLLKEMCNSVNIECEIIPGYAKTVVGDINKKLKQTDHAWNAVKLYGKWYLLDVTWATSYYDKKKRKMIKDFDELYYLTYPEIFVKNHFPEDKKWQLTDKPISKSEFRKAPIFYSSYYELGMSNLSPAKGLIKLKIKTPIEFRFISEQKLNAATITLNDDKNSFYSKIETVKTDEYSIKQKFDKTGEYELSLFADDRLVATYKIIIK